MKQFKKALAAEPRPDPAAVLALANQQAPTLPPTRLAPREEVGQLNLKVKASLIDQLAERAHTEGTSQKAIVCRALAAAGFTVHPSDLENRTNHRRKRTFAS
jgi:hypothetical protein